MKVEPSLDCGLTHAAVSEEPPYGLAAVDWELVDGKAIIHVDTRPVDLEV